MLVHTLQYITYSKVYVLSISLLYIYYEDNMLQTYLLHYHSSLFNYILAIVFMKFSLENGGHDKVGIDGLLSNMLELKQ